ncbi:hypothetical protein L593_07450 [Salinarchaeum sp. Harcht-Bsk1]|uniref:hypothetical protein n=1 Tax=Salinarchaeum sp. Harcht-Bsk1 TaxID=1333523 RepID=UPI0003424057|nr:hypothetical protein [Salinarchaeum sp. Harcht-Bsk1]AGN01435.1 hypothetical protein L593_07450 [Salinarchaeum sp. Harcht-Bsk1]
MSLGKAITPERTTLRKLGIVLLALALVAGAGCSGAVLGGDGGGSSDEALIEYVPQDQTIVMSFDMDVMQDQTTMELLASSENDEASQEDLQEGFSEFESETGLDPSGFNSMLIYGQDTGMSASVGDTSQEDVGILVDTDWSTEDLVSAIESNDSVSLQEQDYSESGVFYKLVDETSQSDEETYVGVHGNGVYVMGTEGPVRNSLDVTYGDGEALSGTLRDAYDDTRDGYMSFAMTMPEDTGTGGGMGSSMTQDIQAMTGVYYTSGDTVGLEGRIIMSNEQSAEQFSSTVQMVLTSYGQDPQMSQFVENLDVGQDGSDVTFTYESDVQTLIEASESQ